MNSVHSNLGSGQNSGNHLQPADVESSVFLSTVVRCTFPLLVCASLSLGFQIPLFFDWAGVQQSYTPLIVGYAFGGFLGACAVSFVLLPLLPKLKRDDPVRNPLIHHFRFPIPVIVSAIMIAGLFVDRDAALVIIGATLFMYPILCAARLGMASRSLRWRIMALYSCMYLPFVWVLGNDVFLGALKQGSLVFAPLLAAAPTLLYAFFISRVFGEQHAMMMLSAVALAGLEALLGLWIVQLGARRAIAYLILLLAASVIASFGFYGMLRA